MPPVHSHDEYTLYIRLAEIEPVIWRRIVVPGQLTLHQLHYILQVTMGWTHSHLHQFVVPGTNESTYYGEPSPEDDYFHKDDRLVRLAKTAPRKAPPSSTSMISVTPGNMRSPLKTFHRHRKVSRRIRGAWMGSEPALLKTWAVPADTQTFWKRGASGATQSISRCGNGWGSIFNQDCFRYSKSMLG